MPRLTIYYTANHNISTIYNNIFPDHFTKRHSKQSPQLQRLAKIAISYVAGLDVILSNTDAQAGTSLLFANPEDRCSLV